MRYPVLSWRLRLALLGLVVAQFLLLHGRVWERHFDWDASILWSYASIPFLVTLALLWRKRLHFVSWLIHTVELTVLKFAVTASVLFGVLMVRGEERPPPPPAPAAVVPQVGVRAAEPTPSALGPTGAVSGRAEPGALVYISSGLEGLVFARPTAVAELEHVAHGFQPELSVIRVGQELKLRSSIGPLHTAKLLDPTGRGVSNVPLRGGDVTVPGPRSAGEWKLVCTVHAPAEATARLIAVDHPYVTRAGADGSFLLEGLPARPLKLSTGAEVQIRPNETTEINRGGSR